MPIRYLLLLLLAALCLKADCGDAQEIFSQVNTLLRSHKYDEAATALDKLRPCTTLSPIDRFEMGWLYGRARNFTAALSAFNTVPEDVPDVPTHKYAVALSKFELADYRGAVDVLRSLGSQSQFESKSANLLAVSYSKLGLLHDAYLVLVQDIHDYPHDLSAYLNLITVCAEGGNFNKAAAVATDASGLFPQSSEVFVVLGAANTLLGHLDEAQKNFATAAVLSPTTAEPRFFIALTRYKLGDYAAAVTGLKSAIADGIADPDVHYLLAECLLKLDPMGTPAAIVQLNRAVELNSNSISARTLRGRLLLESHHLGEAVTDLQLANRLDPTSRSAAYNLARAYRAQGKTAEAESLFKSLRSESTNTLTEFSDKRLNQALQQSSSGDPQ
jgi:Flp pilus assembly protein TadD